MQAEPQEPELTVDTSNNNYYDNNDKYCRKCDKWFTRCRDRTRHIHFSKAHKNNPRYECPICGKVFSRQDIQKKHQGNKSCLDRFFTIIEEAGMSIPKL